MARTPYKGPNRHFQRYLIKYNYEHHLLCKAELFPIISKWTHNENIHNALSNNFWNNPHISEAQIKQLIKFCTRQYMGNTRKHLFWPNQFPNPKCTLCPTQSINTWTHVLLNYTQHHLHAIRTQCHNKVVWEIRKLLLSHPTSRNSILMNAGTFNNNPPENTVPHCSCHTIHCHCNA